MVKKKKKLDNNEKDEYKPFFSNHNNKLNIYTVKTSLKSILIDYDNNYGDDTGGNFTEPSQNYILPSNYNQSQPTLEMEEKISQLIKARMQQN